MSRRRLPVAEDWCSEQLADPEYRAAFADELRKLHLEAIQKGNPDLARWCMTERARVARLGKKP